MHYELYYWPGIQGRGELPRLVLEDTGTPYVDVGRQPGGMERIKQVLAGGQPALLPFAPPFLRAGEVWLAQSALITSYLGEHLGLVPEDEQPRLVARTLMLTIADFVAEIHDTHHPIAVDKYYEDQKPAAAAKAASFRDKRLPKFTRYLESCIARTGQGVLVGREVSYVDLAAFQIVEGASYAFPRAFAKLHDQLPGLLALRDRVAKRTRLAAYLASDRRLPFNEHGIFRHYPELDG